MLTITLVALVAWMALNAGYTVYKVVVNPRRTVLRWSWGDLLWLLPYGGFTWALLYILAKGYQR